MPFVTEEIYQNYFKKQEKEKSIHISEWPKYEKIEKKTKEDGWNNLLEVIKNIRQEKSNAKKPMNSEIILTLNKKQFKELKEFLEDLKSVANAKEIKENSNFKVDFI